MFQPAILIGFLQDIFVESTTNPYYERWGETGTTSYCFQHIIYFLPKFYDGSGYLFEMGQQKHLSILNYIGIATIAIVFVVLLCVYIYIAKVVIAFNMRRKADNSDYK